MLKANSTNADNDAINDSGIIKSNENFAKYKNIENLAKYKNIWYFFKSKYLS